MLSVDTRDSDGVSDRPQVVHVPFQMSAIHKYTRSSRHRNGPASLDRPHTSSIMAPGNAVLSIDALPPGTQRINDREATHILLAPQPSSDPNQPLVGIAT